MFGLAALVDDFDDEMIDYGTSGACVFESFTIAMIKRSQSLDVLSHVVHPYGVPLDISCETGPLPSWVPHLEARISNALSSTVFRRHRIRYLYNTSGGSGCGADTSSRGRLAVQGVLWDIIASVGEALDDSSGPANATILNPGMIWY